MKSFFSWFKSSTKMKRWIFTILVGVTLICYAFSKLLVTEVMGFRELAKIIVMFVFGFLCIVFGIVFTQKRTLELIIEADNKESDVNIKSLIFNKKVYDQGPKIIVLGGGKGLNTVVAGLKKYTNNITTIVTMSDYGEPPSESRRQLNILPFKDIKDSIIALSDHEEIMGELMRYDFENNSRLKDLNFGDIYLTAMNEIYQNPPEAIRKSTEVLNITGRVIPVTLDEISICAELSDGTKIEQKKRIEEVAAQRGENIERIYITPNSARPAPGLLEAIAEAEAIVIAPGSLYTNVIPNLLVKGVAKAIKDSKAIKVLVSNIMTEPGQTDNFKLSDHVETIIDHAGIGVFDTVLADNGKIIPEFVRKANENGSEVVEVDRFKVTGLGVRVIERNFSCIKDGEIRHDSDAIAAEIIKLICDELRFQDRTHDSEYLLLNSVYRYQNRAIAKRDKAEKKLLKKRGEYIDVDSVEGYSKSYVKTGERSKYKEKYSDRLESIKKSDKKSRAKIYDDDEDEFEEDYEADDSYEIEQKIKSIDRNERTKNNAKKHYK